MADAKVKMRAPKGTGSVSVDGKEHKVGSDGTLTVEAEHAGSLIAHGFEYVVEEVKKAAGKKAD